MQSNNRLNKRQARYMRDLQYFVGSMTLAYRKGPLDKADPLSLRPNFVYLAIIPLFWDVEVPLHLELRRKSEPLLKDAQLNVIIVNALSRLSFELAYLIRKWHSQDSFYGHQGEWTKDCRIEAIVEYLWRLERRCVPQDIELRLILISESHESSLASQKEVA
jgi:hypothetical protein